MFGTTQKFQELAVSGSKQFNNRFNLLIRLLAEEGFEPPTRGFSDSASMGNRLLLAPCQNVASESFGRAKALGATLGGFEGRVTAVGPVMTYSFSLGKLPVSTQWMWFHEFDVENRATGNAGFSMSHCHYRWATSGCPAETRGPSGQSRPQATAWQGVREKAAPTFDVASKPIAQQRDFRLVPLRHQALRVGRVITAIAPGFVLVRRDVDARD